MEFSAHAPPISNSKLANQQPRLPQGAVGWAEQTHANTFGSAPLLSGSPLMWLCHYVFVYSIACY